MDIDVTQINALKGSLYITLYHNWVTNASHVIHMNKVLFCSVPKIVNTIEVHAVKILSKSV